MCGFVFHQVIIYHNMLRNRVYYRLKPFLPERLRLAMRRWHVRSLLPQVRDVWPINEAAGKKPVDWPGWPDNKQFALVLTHDVESQTGLDRVRPLAELEMRIGFRSCFNFIPEGEYRVSKELRDWLTEHGFEVGVHDLYHDGRLYKSRQAFQENAAGINSYAKEWGAVGFRSGFMLRELDWLHDLNIQYDSSTFDTDPFEPQPDGTGTIFPFWVPARRAEVGNPTSVLRPPSSSKQGYVELPYTLPQDSTLFLLFREKTIRVWQEKLDWIASRGGMALLNVHPDYASFSDSHLANNECSVGFYREFLRHAKAKHAGSYWNALPREVAGHLLKHRERWSAAGATGTIKSSRGGDPVRRNQTIWIDLDNTPHVPFFEPIIEELQARGYLILLTARDAFQVCELAAQKGLACRKIGRHSGRNRIRKVAGLFCRALELAPAALRARPALAVSHGSRSQIIASNFLSIPTLLLADYEFAQYPPLMRPTWEMVPEVIPDEALYCAKDRIRKYSGIKEDVYAWKLRPEPAILTQLHLRPSDLVITVRPPATEAHYHNPESEKLLIRFMDRACRLPQARMVLLPRNKKQGDFIREQWPAWFEDDKTLIPPAALDGMNLIWHSDLVVSGGGTMNREAAALGVPVYSIFRGTIGAVDRRLAQEGRLVLIESENEVETKIRLDRRLRSPLAEVTSRRTLFQIVSAIEDILRIEA